MARGLVQSVLAFEAVTRRYGPSVALDDVSFRIAEGAFVALTGPNGAGKTTLLRLAAGLERADAGRVVVAGSPPAAARSRLAWMGQEPGLYEDLSLAENVAFAARFFGRAQEATHALEACGLTAKRDARARTASRGERQRAAFARALLGGDLMLLDEPTNALDADAAATCIGLLERLRGERTILAATHDPELVKRADHVLILQGGRLA